MEPGSAVTVRAKNAKGISINYWLEISGIRKPLRGGDVDVIQN